jgi:hypothetical protein
MPMMVEIEEIVLAEVLKGERLIRFEVNHESVVHTK